MDEDSGRISRRKLLLTAGTSAALGLAGCPSYVTFCPWVGLKRLRTGDEEIREFIHYGGYVFADRNRSRHRFAFRAVLGDVFTGVTVDTDCVRRLDRSDTLYRTDVVDLFL